MRMCISRGECDFLCQKSKWMQFPAGTYHEIFTIVRESL